MAVKTTTATSTSPKAAALKMTGTNLQRKNSLKLLEVVVASGSLRRKDVADHYQHHYLHYDDHYEEEGADHDQRSFCWREDRDSEARG